MAPKSATSERISQELTMGLFDAVMGQAGQALGGALAGGTAGGAPGGALAELATPERLQALAGWLGQPDTGGVAGLVQRFGQHGLGELVQSWASGGAALPVSPAQLQQVLGADQVQALARSLGFEPQQAVQALTALLPHAVKLLSGQGGAADMLSQGLSLMGGLGGLGGGKR
jgi:uncharacterized protein YidB (DUF937 family)